METQKIANLFGNTDNESLKFATGKWYVINDQNNTDYGDEDEDGTTIKFETKVIKSNLCDYSDAYIATTDEATSKITNTKLYVPIVTLSRKDNAKLVKLLEDGFNRPVYWNEYQTKVETRNLDNSNLTRFPLDDSFEGVRRLFALVFNNTQATIPDNPIKNTTNRVERNNHRKYFLPRVNITNYNVLLDGRNFHDQPINDMIKQHDGIRKIATGQGDDYTTGCLLEYQYFKDHYNLKAIDLSKKKELDAD